MQESLAQQEAMLTAGYDSVLAELRARAASAPAARPAAREGSASAPGGAAGHSSTGGGGSEGGGGADVAAEAVWANPQVVGRMDALRTLLLQADG